MNISSRLRGESDTVSGPRIGVATDDGETATFLLDDLIEGWKIGIPKYGRGGSGKLLVPSNLGYGPNRIGPIPGNSVLVFDIELFDFYQ